MQLGNSEISEILGLVTCSLTFYMKTTTKNNNKIQFSVTYHTWEDNLEHVWTSTCHFWLTKPKYLRHDYEQVGQNLLFEMIILSHYQILPQKSL